MNVAQVKQKYEDRLMELPNVTGVGIGEKQEQEVIKVFVTKKIAESNLKPEEIIPKSLDGCNVDVEEIGTVTAQTQ